MPRNKPSTRCSRRIRPKACERTYSRSAIMAARTRALELLAAVRPHLALISAGRENPYGHPGPELLQRLEDAGVRVLRTDRNGAIHVLADGRQFRVTCFIPCPGNDFAPSRLEEAQSPGHQQHAQ